MNKKESKKRNAAKEPAQKEPPFGLGLSSNRKHAAWPARGSAQCVNFHSHDVREAEGAVVGEQGV
jgi:hypothetical protein